MLIPGTAAAVTALGSHKRGDRRPQQPRTRAATGANRAEEADLHATLFAFSTVASRLESAICADCS